MKVSWMLLERYALGQVTGEERKQVEQALQADELTRARFAEIRGAPQATQEVRTASGTPDTPPQERIGKPRQIRWLGPALAAGLVGAMSMVFIRAQLAVHDTPSRAKGDSLLLSIVSEHGGNTPKLVIGERYSLQVTCVPPREVMLSVSVTQDGKREQPFGQGQRVRCENDAPIGGALVFDSASPAEVCIDEIERRQRSCIDLR